MLLARYHIVLKLEGAPLACRAALPRGHEAEGAAHPPHAPHEEDREDRAEDWQEHSEEELKVEAQPLVPAHAQGLRTSATRVMR